MKFFEYFFYSIGIFVFNLLLVCLIFCFSADLSAKASFIIFIDNFFSYDFFFSKECLFLYIFSFWNSVNSVNYKNKKNKSTITYQYDSCVDSFRVERNKRLFENPDWYEYELRKKDEKDK